MTPNQPTPPERAVPILPVRDLVEAIRHYERLGFEVRSYDDGYAFAARGAVQLHLTEVDGLDPARSNVAARIDTGRASIATQSESRSAAPAVIPAARRRTHRRRRCRSTRRPTRTLPRRSRRRRRIDR